MKVRELIEKLNQFDPELDVFVTDGHRYPSYHGDFDVELFEDTIDIGVGGLTWTPEREEKRLQNKTDQ